MINEQTLDMILRVLKLDPLKFKADFSRCFQQVQSFDQRLKALDETCELLNVKLDLLLDTIGIKGQKVTADFKEPAKPLELIAPTTKDIGHG